MNLADYDLVGHLVARRNLLLEALESMGRENYSQSPSVGNVSFNKHDYPDLHKAAVSALVMGLDETHKQLAFLGAKVRQEDIDQVAVAAKKAKQIDPIGETPTQVFTSAIYRNPSPQSAKDGGSGGPVTYTR